MADFFKMMEMAREEMSPPSPAAMTKVPTVGRTLAQSVQPMRAVPPAQAMSVAPPASGFDAAQRKITQQYFQPVVQSEQINQQYAAMAQQAGLLQQQRQAEAQGYVNSLMAAPQPNRTVTGAIPSLQEIMLSAKLGLKV